MPEEVIKLTFEMKELGELPPTPENIETLAAMAMEVVCLLPTPEAGRA